MNIELRFKILFFLTSVGMYGQNITNLDWQNGFGLTHNIDIDSIASKPVRFYLENKNCSAIAKDFYYGNYRPTDEEKTERLLKLAITTDNNLRPFYRWILNKTIIIQDGALGEYTGEPARRYAEIFPNEFFKYMDSDKSGERYSNWFNSILYSGFYKADDFKNPKKIRENMIKIMNENCKECDSILRKRITTFASDCFPNK